MVKESDRNTIGDFASDGFYPGAETVLSDFNENPRSQKHRISVEGGMQRETMDSGVDNYRFTMSFKLTSFKHLPFQLSNNVEAGSSPYTHTFSLNASTTYNFFSLQRIFNGGSNIHTYLGCFVMRTRYEWQKATGDDEAGYIKVTQTCMSSSFSKEITAKTVPEAVAREVFTFNEFKATIGGAVKSTVVSGSIEIDAGVNPDDFFYCNAVNDKTIGTPSPVFFKTVGNLTINVEGDTLIDEMLEDSISGVNKFEFIKDNTNNKLVINFADIFNVQAFAPTNYRAINQSGAVYDATISSIVATDLVENY